MTTEPFGKSGHIYPMAKPKKVSVSFEGDDIPVLIDSLEDYIDSLCDDPDCEHCVMRSVTVQSIIEMLYTKSPKVEIKTEL